MITVTAATGHLGRLVIADLLTRGVAAGEITAAVRDPDKAADLAELGVRVRLADYNRPETLESALTGTDRLLLISSNEMGRRTTQHTAVVHAAARAGVSLIAYTSILRADTSSMLLAGEHLATENVIRDSGLDHVLLRNGWYLENYTDNLAPALAHGALLGAARDGRISAASRADYASAAGAVLTGDGHVDATYELGGDHAFTLTDLAAEITKQSDTQVAYADLPEAEYAQALIANGVPDVFAEMLADSDRGITRGDLFTDSTDLARLIGRPATTVAQAVAAALRAR